jgi:Domain of unknown function (DUF6438)
MARFLIMVALGLLASSNADAGEIADLHHEITGGEKVSGFDKPIDIGAKHQISELGIEREWCYGKCPIYTFIAFSDGSFRYSGKANVDRLGNYTGKLSWDHFNRVAEFIADAGYMDMQNTYIAGPIDAPGTFTTVVLSGERKTIWRSYGAVRCSFGRLKC